MPEGDTLRRAEAALSPILDGQVTTELWFRKLRGEYRPRVGYRIENVNAVGKHLLINFERRVTLRTHLAMAGSWRALAADAEAPQDRRLRVLIRTDKGTAVCFAAPTIDTFLRDSGTSPIDHLGPDLSNDHVDIEEIVARTRRFANDSLVAEALLDQRVAAGVGNVFKSEVAFLAGLHPFTAVAALNDSTIGAMWEIAHHQLLNNRGRDRRKTTARTVFDDTHVYGRFRKACRRCPNSVLFSKAGLVTERSSYWCPGCQGEPVSDSA